MKLNEIFFYYKKDIYLYNQKSSEEVYIYIYIYFFLCCQTIVINCIQFIVIVYMCVYCVYLLCVYKYTHIQHIFENIYMYIFILQFKYLLYKHNNFLKYIHVCVYLFMHNKYKQYTHTHTHTYI